MKIIKKIFIFFFILAFIMWVVKFTSYNLRIEGYSGMILEFFLPNHETVFAENYSDKGFLQINKGMTEEEVIKILGEPLVRWVPENNYIGFQYSESKESTHYSLRQVYFTQGKVKEIIGYYYID